MPDTNGQLRQHIRQSEAVAETLPAPPPLSAAEIDLLARRVLALLRDEVRQDRLRWRQDSSSL